LDGPLKTEKSQESDRGLLCRLDANSIKNVLGGAHFGICNLDRMAGLSKIENVLVDIKSVA
jgi:hypothetical protein